MNKVLIGIIAFLFFLTNHPMDFLGIAMILFGVLMTRVGLYNYGRLSES